MKIYLVTTGEYSDYRVEGAFSTKEKAEKLIAKFKKYKTESYIEEYELDNAMETIKLDTYFVEYNLVTKKVLTCRKWEYFYYGSENSKDNFSNSHADNCVYGHVNALNNVEAKRIVLELFNE